MNYLMSYCNSNNRNHDLAGRLARAALLACLLPGLVAAQGSRDADDATDSMLYRGEILLRNGSYAVAAEILQMADGVDREDGIVGASRAYAMMGNMQEAVRVCEEAIEDGDYGRFPLISTQLAEVERARGRSDRALEILEAVIEDNFEPPVRALVQYGSLLQFRGRRQEAVGYLDRAAQRYNDGMVFAPEEVTMVALASWLLGNYHDASSLFNEATRADPDNLEAHVLWADLFYEKYNPADAELGYQDALEINSRYVPALVGITKANGNERGLERALMVNPNSTLALEAQAGMLISQGDKEEGVDRLEQALELNPESLSALGALASLAALEERMDDFAEYQARVEAFSPGNAELLGIVAKAFGDDYRFAEAVEYARAAIELDPEYWEGYTLLGSNLIRLGEEDEGKRYLEIGFDNDPFNVMASNMLTLFDSLEDFETRESEHFTVRMTGRDVDVLWPYLEPLLEESWDTLTAKYDFEPEGPILIEIFDRKEDFSVRSVGLPSIGPLVGICFGKVITLISPDTLVANWQEIVWHEFSHIITLQMTRNRLPRWLSEGVAVWEEGRRGRTGGASRGWTWCAPPRRTSCCRWGGWTPALGTPRMPPTCPSPIFSPIWWLISSPASSASTSWWN